MRLAQEGLAELAAERRLLLVEDDTAVREVISRVLARAGFAVEQAVSVEAALATLERVQGSVALVLSDVKLRGLSGLDLARVIRERWPRLPVCLLSGRPDRRRYPRYETDRGYLEKPSSVAELLTEVERLTRGDARRMPT
jgi:two-component system, cell cycle sensor histidine kinase and response regulator CckA